MSKAGKMDQTVAKIVQTVEGYWPGVDRDFLIHAYEFARERHEGQTRASGEPYIRHPVLVAEIVTSVEGDPFSVAAAFMHDVLEDTDTSVEEIRERFGPTVATLVEGVTNLHKLDFATRQETQARNLRKMFLAMAEDVRVILIKLCDRLHNMRTLEHLPEDRRVSNAMETLHIFAPLAHRLGVWRLKWELEDLALKWLEPEKYEEIAEKLGMSRTEREQLITTARAALEKHLEQGGIKARVQGRAKHIYSIYDKMERQHIDFAQIADLNALRVIVNTVGECYAALGIIHDLWMPVPDMFSDYIAKPKANKYQSLHTKVIGPDSQILEVQIRTEQMHRIAEYGVAAHWSYKEGDTDPQVDEQVAWIRQFLELETDLRESHEFLELLQLDLFQHQVFVFTPKGDVIELPAGSGPLDFAYRIHTEVGHHCVGARVNGRRVGLDYEFKNGDVAEIITSPNAEPTHSWLRIAKSSGAKTKVRRFLRGKAREESIDAGKELLDRAIQRLNPVVRNRIDMDKMPEIATHLGYSDVESLLAALGFGDIEADTVTAHLQEFGHEPSTLVEAAQQLALPDSPAPKIKGALPVKAGAVAGFHSRISRCCNPLPGDEICGYITRGKGLAIHRTDCKNLLYRMEREPNRIVPLSWSDDDATEFYQNIEVIALNRVGVLSHLTAIIADADIDIHAVEARSDDGHLAHVKMTLAIRNRDDLNRLIKRLEQLIDVVSVSLRQTNNQAQPATS